MHQISISCLVSLSFNLSKVDGLGVHLHAPIHSRGRTTSSPGKGHQRQREKLTNNLIRPAHKLNTSRPSHLSCRPVDTCLVTTPSLPTNNLMHVSRVCCPLPQCDGHYFYIHLLLGLLLFVGGLTATKIILEDVFLLTEMVKKC